MTNQHSFVSSDRFDRDLYTSSKTAERVLNAAIVRAEVTESFEEYLEIFDAFYADDVEVSSDTETILGKAKIRSLLFNFLIPLHVMAEVVVFRYLFEKPRFLEILQARHILRGHST